MPPWLKRRTPLQGTTPRLERDPSRSAATACWATGGYGPGTSLYRSPGTSSRCKGCARTKVLTMCPALQSLFFIRWLKY